MRRALIVGIDYYKFASRLYGCVGDAYAVKNVLERHSDGSVNFSARLIVSSSETDAIERSVLRRSIEELFADDADVALLYFAGHGYVDATGGYLCASDTQNGDEGIPLHDVVHFAMTSKTRNKIIILDSCHSGVAASRPALRPVSELAEGMTILTASTEEQYAKEEDGCGVFTSLLVDALNGAACNLLGDVTPGAAYAHIDQSLGGWEQRPVFKTNVKSFVSLRKAQPPIALIDLQRIATLFPSAGYEYPLSPEYEPESGVANPERTEIFSVLQRYVKVNLVVPFGASQPHMYFAAMENKSCKLTALGEHYRRLVAKGKI